MNPVNYWFEQVESTIKLATTIVLSQVYHIQLQNPAIIGGILEEVLFLTEKTTLE